jgi:AraC-like DNA-binding protein
MIFPMGKTTRPARPEVLVALRRARDFTDRDFARPLTLDSMANVANMSKFHFARTFTKVYGETPRTYLTRRRIERAKDMLRAANLTITEICFLVGFESLGSFSSRFRDLVGMSPTEYRLASFGAPPIPGCFVLMWTRPGLSANEQSGRSASGESRSVSDAS